TQSGVGQPYAVNWSVTVNAPGAGTPTGTVLVSDGTDSCTAAVAAGTCNLTSTTTGNKTITATYSGDANFNSSVSAGVPHTVVGTIWGNIKLAPAFTNLANVTMSLTGTQTMTTITDANGNYTFSGLQSGGNYTVTPTMSGKQFDPASRSYTAFLG